MIRVPHWRVWLSAALAMILLASATVVPANADSTEFTDIPHDAYLYPEPIPPRASVPRPPNPVLSNEMADLIVVSFASASPTRPDHERAYAVSLTVTGQPDPSFEYFAAAEFGERCFLFHPLRPGQANKAEALCPQDPADPTSNRYRHAGFMEGTEAVVAGQTISATYGFRESTLPDSLAQQPEFGPLWAFACSYSKEEAYGFGCNVPYDDVRDQLATFRI